MSEKFNLKDIRYLKEESDLYIHARKVNSIIIYGGGKVATVLIRYLHLNQLSDFILGIVVSDKTNNPDEILGIPVYSIDVLEQYDRDTPIIIATLENNHQSIYNELSKRSFEDIYAVSNMLYAKLRKANPSYEAEIFQAVNTLKRMQQYNNIHTRNLEDILIRTFNKTFNETFYKTDEWWHDRGERNFLLANFTIQSTDFKDKFIKLIDGLDEESIETVVRILVRQQKILKSNALSIDLFTEKEKKQLKELRENFRNLILQLDDEVYSYKKYILPCNHFEASVFYYKHGIEKIRDLNAIKGKNIIDAGGFIGDSALVFMELEPACVYSFEALPEHFELMKKTVSLNKMKNIIGVNCALGKNKGTIVMNMAGSGTSYLNRGDVEYKGKIEVPLISLDEYVQENNLKNIGLIKADIEGAEPDFLVGAQKTIKENKPVLLLSIYHNMHDFFELKQMIEEWRIGYKFSIFKPVDGNVTPETLLIAQVY